MSLGAQSVLWTRAKLIVMRVCNNIDQYVRCPEEWQKVVAAAAADALESVRYSQAAQRAADFDRCMAIGHVLDYFSARSLAHGAGPF